MKRFAPLFGFAVLMALFFFGIWWNSQHVSNYVPSPLIGKPAPAFELPRLDDPAAKVSRADLLGKPYLLNVFASWCFACGEEHPVLMRDAQALGIALIGYNYKDEPDDARAWLNRNGNPYHEVLVDYSGETAMDFGIYGAPETFLIDATGVVRYKHIGPLTPQAIGGELAQAIRDLGTTR